MALVMIKMKNGNRRVVPADKARAMFLVQAGQMRGTPEQVAYVKGIERIYLNYATAPLSYKKKYPREEVEPKQLELWWTK